MSVGKIVNISGFIESIRHLGITTTDAVNELVDNSFDANANNIWISIFKNPNGTLQLRIEDDGSGVKQENISRVLAFGGRVPGAGVTTGKFGWGLSSSACCQASRTDFYSKTEGNKFYYNYIDLKEIERSNGELPETVVKNPFSLVEALNLPASANSGTIIIMRELLNPERRREDVLARILSENLAEVQRRFLASGRKIHIQGREVKFYDPLLLMDASDGLDRVSKAVDYAEIDPVIYQDIKDEAGNPAKVEIKLSKLPVAEIMRNQLQQEYPFMINVQNQGFYIMRHNRQIGSGQTLHLFSKNPMLNYFRAEISFPPCLDDKFGVQTNKSRFSLEDQLREELEKRVEKFISQMRIDIKEEADAYKASRNKETQTGRPISEEIAAVAAEKLKPSAYKPTAEENKRVEAELDQEKKRKEAEINASQDLSAEDKRKAIETLKIAFQHDRIFRREVGVIGTGEFYKIKHKGTRIIEVIINEAHGFYRDIYEKASQIPEQQILLDLFLFTLAITEDQFYDNKTAREFYETQRREWSANMSRFLDVARQKLEGTDLTDEP